MEEACSFNVFVRHRQPDLHCAVRQDHPIPTFIRQQVWSFACTIDLSIPSQPAPRGFRPDAAHEAMRLTGFYLFHAG
jgi:hypothetical protein